MTEAFEEVLGARACLTPSEVAWVAALRPENVDAYARGRLRALNQKTVVSSERHMIATLLRSATA